MPIVPGVVLLDEMVHAIEVAHHASIAQWNIAWAKFRSRVAPGESLTLHYEQRPDSSISFVIRTSSRVVADGVITPSSTEAPGVP